MGFRGEMRRALGGKGRAVVEIAESEGLDATIEQLVLDALDRDPTIGAVYSIGGGNVATSARSSSAAAATGCSSPTTSTRTTGRCCAPGRSRRCCITICGPTPNLAGRMIIQATAA